MEAPVPGFGASKPQNCSFTFLLKKLSKKCNQTNNLSVCLSERLSLVECPTNYATVPHLSVTLNQGTNRNLDS